MKRKDPGQRSLLWIWTSKSILSDISMDPQPHGINTVVTAMLGALSICGHLAWAETYCIAIVYSLSIFVELSASSIWRYLRERTCLKTACHETFKGFSLPHSYPWKKEGRALIWDSVINWERHDEDKSNAMTFKPFFSYKSLVFGAFCDVPLILLLYFSIFNVNSAVKIYIPLLKIDHGVVSLICLFI